MSFLSGITNGMSPPLWENNPPSQPISERCPKGMFQEALASFSLEWTDLQECIERCCKCVEEGSITESDCDLSDVSQQVILLQLENFNIAVDETRFLTIKQVESLKSAFKTAFANIVEEKWASVSAKLFYEIPKIENINQRASAAEKWSEQFYSGMDYFYKWDDEFFLDGDQVADLQKLLLPVYRAYYYEVKQQKTEVFAARAEKDPIGFQSFIQAVDEKQERRRIDNIIPIYSEEEEDVMECARFLTSCATLNFTAIDDEMKALRKCIWNGYTIREFKGLMTLQLRHELFVKAFS
ncbi:MAG: hypothetical protein WA347_04030 [Rhabdochlamydiaceae bacterium]|jgi:hypothetical protein